MTDSSKTSSENASTVNASAVDDARCDREGKLLRQLKRPAEAAKAFARAAQAAGTGSATQRDNQFLQAVCLVEAGEPGAAIASYQALLATHADFATGWRMLGMLQKRQGDMVAAIHSLRTSLALEDDIPTRNALVLALARTGQTDSALIEGLRNLEHKDAQAQRTFVTSPFRDSQLSLIQRTFNPDTPSRNIIAFSLWGCDPTYIEGAIANARIAPHIYYRWTPRFYCDSSVPCQAIDELRQLNAQVVLLEDPAWQAVRPFWRFLASDDPGVDFFLCRDADSRLNCQELMAVEDWLKSGKPFHAMRDHVYHMELILAGLWGGMAGVLPNLRELMFGHPQYFNNRFGDQAFLMNVIWPMVRDHILVHDSYYRFRGSKPFPEGCRLPRPVHVGGAVKIRQ